MLADNINKMVFKIFKQKGKDVIINIENIVSIEAADTSGKTIIHTVNQANEVDGSLEEIKIILGIGQKKEIRGF
jgi:DNA-binding LytR/AlgR family response regulator